jgi:phosphoribosylanthranilate isomerase
MTRIKICGIKTEAAALAAAAAGADFIGLVFASSPRQVTPTQANKIIATLKEGSTAAPEIVGVFVNAPAAEVNAIAAYFGLNYVQLSGRESPEYCRQLAVPLIKAIHVGKDQGITCDELAATGQSLFLFDTYDAAKYGGTGKSFDWDLARPVAGKFRVIIAGGLTPDNVAAAIKAARPWGVDVSSGVETGGEKDLHKIKAFIKAVRDADATPA